MHDQRGHVGQPEDAILGACLICELCRCVPLTEDTADDSSELLQEIEEKSGRKFLRTACLYLPAGSAFPGSLFLSFLLLLQAFLRLVFTFRASVGGR